MALLDPVKTRVDVGRLVMVPCATLMLCADALVLAQSSGTGALRWVGDVMVMTFYALIIWAYLRREPAKATSTSYAAHTAAVTATLLPFTLPLLAGGPPGAGQELVADALLVVGSVWSIWSLRSLGKNLSVIAQARDVVEHGPYRWVRHPLYSGEIVSSLGVLVAAGSPAAVGVWILLVALQVYRALREEHVLLGTLPAYADYRTRTAALLPGVI
ncbi:methyltransferase family protein [Kribbella sp. NPDC048928]|uniref:methyltransferase family protein n=1 Tax=Kribbella sp. NPDC048928 TaxID=3364111 RepID=UPI003712A36B